MKKLIRYLSSTWNAIKVHFNDNGSVEETSTLVTLMLHFPESEEAKSLEFQERLTVNGASVQGLMDPTTMKFPCFWIRIEAADKNTAKAEVLELANDIGMHDCTITRCIDASEQRKLNTTFFSSQEQGVVNMKTMHEVGRAYHGQDNKL